MAIVLKDVSYSKIIKKVNLQIKYGNIVSIIGKNGSGKTTLLEILVGKNNEYEGSVKSEGQLRISYIEQDLKKTFFCDTLEKEIEYSLEEINYPQNKIKKRIMDSIKMIGLPEYFLNRDPFTLSTSELRLAALARAVSINPDLIVIDEPIIGMSEVEKNNLIQILKKIKRRYNKTIVLVSQNMDFIHKISDYIYVISNGKIILEGDKYSVFKKEKILIENNLFVPSIIEFENYVLNNKKIKLGYRDDINDLVKDILRNIK